MRSLPLFCPGHYVHVPWRPTARSSSERVTGKSRSRLLPRTVRSFQSINMTSNTITINKEGISNVISTAQATYALRPKGAPASEQLAPGTQSYNACTIEQSIQDVPRDASTPEARRDRTHQVPGHVPPAPHATRNTNLYVVHHIVRHVNTRDGLRYISRW